MWKLILLILAGLYTLNPYDIFPDLMIGWGWLDDLVIWILLWRFFVSRNKTAASHGRNYQSGSDRFQNRQDRNFSGRGPSGSNDRSSDDPAEGQWDPYRVLRVDSGASIEEIKHAYRELASKYHPDKLEHLGDDFKALAEMRFKEIQQAYQELTGKGS
jgi:DnaJ like chaperone protein